MTIHRSHDRSHPSPRLEEPTRHEWLCHALRELLVEKGVLSAEQVRKGIEAKEALVAEGHRNGARIVARAWADEGFHERLLEDGRTAIAELGLELREAQLVVTPNAPTTHNLIVCTLCSCYPRSILGEPPLWYTTTAYRSRAVREPRRVLAEFGLQVPPEVEIRVHESNADMRYLVLPERPEGTEGWSENDLTQLITRDMLLGTALPRVDVLR